MTAGPEHRGNKRVCVLGAGGAIGSRLVQSLADQGWQVTAVVRRLHTAVRVARYPIALVSIDLSCTSEQELANVLRGHDLVIDCTFSAQQDCRTAVEESESMADTLIAALKIAAVNELIHYGTISVYPMVRKGVDEQIVCTAKNLAYADGKLAVQKRLLAAPADLNVLVLQLPIVVGPFMGWSKTIGAQWAQGSFTMPSEINGYCDPIHVDDVIAATILASDFIDRQKQPCRELILLGSENAVKWVDFYQCFADQIPDAALHLIPTTEFYSRVESRQMAQRPWQQLRRLFSDDGDFRQLILAQWGVRAVYKAMKKWRGQAGMDQLKSRLSQAAQTEDSRPGDIISAAMVETFESLPKISSDKALRKLGFKPRMSVQDCVEDTCAWLRWAGLLDQ